MRLNVQGESDDFASRGSKLWRFFYAYLSYLSEILFLLGQVKYPAWQTTSWLNREVPWMCFEKLIYSNIRFHPPSQVEKYNWAKPSPASLYLYKNTQAKPSRSRRKNILRIVPALPRSKGRLRCQARPLLKVVTAGFLYPFISRRTTERWRGNKNLKRLVAMGSCIKKVWIHFYFSIKLMWGIFTPSCNRQHVAMYSVVSDNLDIWEQSRRVK